MSLWKKKEPKSTNITKEDIDHISERMLQKNLNFNNTIIDQKLKQDEKDIKLKQKRNKQADKIIKKALH